MARAARLHTHFSVTATDLQQWSVERLRQLLELLAGQGKTLIEGTLGFLLHLVLALFLLFFFLRGWRGDDRAPRSGRATAGGAQEEAYDPARRGHEL